MRCVARKVGLYVLKMTPPWRCSFQMSELAYDSIPPLRTEPSKSYWVYLRIL